ncbi:prepilin-type N-terminal cleavage/methylation domain-containing protein [Candidatus Microgenomates bacterium]|jgi:prepilin-type N-terminal cleavage/methylation domain-containing protein|nr:MAG: prepilin-type N-terminal cleavage/methylation domain-containing protein [Candidatus Microgenomates bacterium]
MGRKDNKNLGKTAFLKKEKGLTLIEILIVATVVGLLALLVALSINPSIQIGKGRDARRKSDLKKIATSLEDYAGDHGCYPAAIYSTGCTVSAEFDPYIKRMPCDPLTNEPYPYERPEPDNCKYFVVYATLENESMGSFIEETNYFVTSPNLNLVPTSAGSQTGFYGCFNGVCRPITEDYICDPKYDVIDFCETRCGAGVNECTYVGD